MSNIIVLTQGQVAVVSSEDYEEVSKYKWYAKKQRTGVFYAMKRLTVAPGVYSHITMHSFILGRNEIYCIDHINGNGLDNRRVNLRFVTTAQNGANRRKHKKKCTSRYKGVRLKGSKWEAYITVNKVLTYIGTFKTEDEAAKAYNKVAYEKSGVYAHLNVIAGEKR